MQMVPKEMLHLNQPGVPAISTAGTAGRAAAVGGGRGGEGGLAVGGGYQTRPRHKAAMNSISRNNERLETSSLKCKTQRDTALRNP